MPACDWDEHPHPQRIELANITFIHQREKHFVNDFSIFIAKLPKTIIKNLNKEGAQKAK